MPGKRKEVVVIGDTIDPRKPLICAPGVLYKAGAPTGFPDRRISNPDLFEPSKAGHAGPEDASSSSVPRIPFSS